MPLGTKLCKPVSSTVPDGGVDHDANDGGGSAVAAWMEAKTRDAMLRARIEHGAKCAPFVSAAIIQTLKEVYPVEAEDFAAQVELGRV